MRGEKTLMGWPYTPDHSATFYEQVRVISEFLECEVMDLLGTLNAESGVSAKARNPASSATGLPQVMRPHYEGWGFTRDQFAALPADVQVAYVKRYLSPYRGKMKTAAGVYTAIFLPAYVEHAQDLDYVLCARGGKLGWAFAANSVFDANGDGRITVGELLQAIRRNWQGPRCNEMLTRAGIRAPEWSAVAANDADDLRTVLGVQRKLIALGFDLGPAGADGVPGMKTREALIAFQKAHAIDAIGIAGPRTQAALRAA